MTGDDLLKALEDWYAAQVDGEWEHSFGVEISTLDNPGWAVSIDLHFTDVANHQMATLRIERDPADWYECRIQSGVFQGFGGARNLRDIISAFLQWKESVQKPFPTGS